MTGDLTEHPVGTILLPPEPPEHAPGPRHGPADPDACRIIRVAVAHPDEWPWRRLTGLASAVPAQWADLSDWRVQPLGDVGLTLGHPCVLSGHEVSR